MMKTMLEYKSHQAGVVFEEVNEAYTTQEESPPFRAGSMSIAGPGHDQPIWWTSTTPPW
jgi:hypothetical protein